MYRIIALKRGRPNLKNVVDFIFIKSPSKFVECTVAKKTVYGGLNLFVLSNRRLLMNNIFYKLTHRHEFKKKHVTLYLSVTGFLFGKATQKIYKDQVGIFTFI